MKSGYWNVSSFTVKYTNETQGVEASTQLDPTFVSPTPFYFSYHCYKPAPIQPANSTTHAISVLFVDLQVS